MSEKEEGRSCGFRAYFPYNPNRFFFLFLITFFKKYGVAMLDKKIAFVGSGAMGEAMISGLIRQGLSRPENLLTADTRAERVQELHEKYGVQPFTDNTKATEHADVVVLSVKPQRLTEVLKGLKSSVPA